MKRFAPTLATLALGVLGTVASVRADFVLDIPNTDMSVNAHQVTVDMFISSTGTDNLANY